MSEKSMTGEQMLVAAREYVAFTNGVVDYMVGQGIRDVGLIDSRARLAYIGIAHAWRNRARKDAAMPRNPAIHFFNPKGFRTQESTEDTLEQLYYQDDTNRGLLLEPPTFRRSDADLVRDFSKQHPGAYEARRRPFLLFDGCMHSGMSAMLVVRGLQKAGFENTHFGVAHDEMRAFRVVQPDFALTYKNPVLGCNMFGSGTFTHKSYATVAPLARPGHDRAYGLAIRHQWHEVMRLADQGYL